MSFPKHPKYKDSGVEWLGEVPDGWQVTKLGRLLERNDGGAWGDDPDGSSDVLVLRSTEQSEDGRWRIEEPAKRKLTQQAHAATLLVADDLLVTKSSGSALHIGKTTIVDAHVETLKCGYSNFMQRLRVDLRMMTPRLAWYVLNNTLTRYQFDLLSNSTSGLANLNASILNSIVLSLGSIAEQQTIVEFLDQETAKIDALIEEQRRLIELLKEKRQAVISQAITKGIDPTAPMKDVDVDWMRMVPATWKLTKLSRLVTTRKGVAFSAADFAEQGVAVVKASDIKGLTLKAPSTCLPAHYASSYPRALLVPKEIVLSTVGSAPDVINSAVGQIASVPESHADALLNQNTVVFTPLPGFFLDGFLILVLQTRGYRDHLDLHAHGTANQASLNVSDMLAFPVALPSYGDQANIVEYVQNQLEKLSALLSGSAIAIDLLRERRFALISAAVTGKIDVRNYKPQPSAVPEDMYEPA